MPKLRRMGAIGVGNHPRLVADREEIPHVVVSIDSADHDGCVAHAGPSGKRYSAIEVSSIRAPMPGAVGAR